MAILSLQNVTKYYGTYKANDNISFEVPEGSIFGLLGPNGAGKSTLIRIITNIIAADSGTILINGEKQREAHHAIIGYMPEERGLYKKMKVGEHLVYLARLKNLGSKGAKAKIEFWMDRFAITDWWDKKIEELSKGMQQKIQFIGTIVHDPKLLILDEPFSGLDPINSNLIKDEIYNLKEKGASIIFSTHRMEQVEEICEEIVLVNHGKLLLNGKVKDIRQRFKKHRFSIHLENDIPLMIGDGRFQVIQQTHLEAIIQADENAHANDLLKVLVEKEININAFHEVLPSINDIFIDQVTKAYS
ncbi:MAG: ATP-binding cassette domain-containing protein [Chitinophagales bacterium]|nr:ATP-binding cassette domain-containing protein [Chitinophagales bacterium]